MLLKASFVDHFDRQFRTLDGIYPVTSDAAWSYGDPVVKGVWQWTYHVLETIDFYMGEQVEFESGKQFGVDWEETEAPDIPTQGDMKAYQDLVKQKTSSILKNKSEADFGGKETVFTWTGDIYAGRLMYLLRHTQQHVGDINQVLRLVKCDTLTWH